MARRSNMWRWPEGQLAWDTCHRHLPRSRRGLIPARVARARANAQRPCVRLAAAAVGGRRAVPRRRGAAPHVREAAVVAAVAALPQAAPFQPMHSTARQWAAASRKRQTFVHEALQ